jgi:hypothetical protein
LPLFTRNGASPQLPLGDLTVGRSAVHASSSWTQWRPNPTLRATWQVFAARSQACKTVLICVYNTPALSLDVQGWNLQPAPRIGSWRPPMSRRQTAHGGAKPTTLFIQPLLTALGPTTAPYPT